MKLSVSELHAANPYDHTKRRWPYPESLEAYIAQAGDLHTQEDPVAYLDGLLETDYTRASAINRALLHLPPEAVYDNFGVEVTAWSSLNTAIDGENDGLNKVLAEKAGFNLTDLEIARGWVWRKARSSTGKLILAQYNLMQTMKDSAVTDVDLPAILRNNARDAVDISDRRAADYQVAPIETGAYNSYYDGGRVYGYSGELNGKVASGMWLDSPIGFTLLYRGLPNAMVALAMSSPDEVMVHQLQGVRLAKIDQAQRYGAEERYARTVGARGLPPIDWQKALVEVTESIAANIGATSTGIQAGMNNVWTRQRLPTDQEPHLPMASAKKAYDETASRLGYSKREDDRRGNWHKILVVEG